MRLKYLSLLICILLNSCSSEKLFTNDYSQFLTQKLIERDSLFFLYTISKWRENDWWVFRNPSLFHKISLSEVAYSLDATFYSPDSNRVIVWVGETMPNRPTIEKYSKDPQNDLMCSGSPIEAKVFHLKCVIGQKDTINKLWNIYPFDYQSVECSKSNEWAIQILGDFYLRDMKKKGNYMISQEGSKKGYMIDKEYGYNIQEKEFWYKCWVFQKDTVGSKGLYIFQIKSYDYNGVDPVNQNSAKPYNTPKIDYPKEILNLFKKH